MSKMMKVLIYSERIYLIRYSRLRRLLCVATEKKNGMMKNILLPINIWEGDKWMSFVQFVSFTILKLISPPGRFFLTIMEM